MKAMKKLTALLLALVMALALCACSNQGDAPTPSTTPSEAAEESTAPSQGAEPAALTTAEEGKLHMATNAAFPPYEMLADDGSFEGIDVEVAAEIAKKLGLELVVDDMGFTAALTAAANGQSDIVMAGVTVNKERQQTLDFTDSYATGVQVVIVKEGSDVTMDNLGEKMIGTQMGTTGYIYASDTPVAVEALKGGQIDCVIIDNEPAKAYVAANEGLTLLEGTWVTENYAIGVKKGNTQLVDAVNAALKELIEDGTVQRIIDKYIPAE